MSETDQDDSQKTEEPTPKRLEDARKKGQVALSREINNWIMLCTATVLIGAFASNILAKLSLHLRGYIENAHVISSADRALSQVLQESFFDVLSIMALPFLVLMVAAFVAPFIQVGPLFAVETIKPDISKISPFKGFKRLFSVRSIMEFLKGILKIGLIGFVGLILLYPFYGQVEHLVGLPILLVLNELSALILRLLVGILVVLIVVAVIDLIFQRQEHYKKMRMTKQELKDEYKQTEGDPHIRARLRQLRHDRARQRMMQAVPEADVVITNPTHFSIALKYKPDEMEAPLCVAKGVDQVALRIREVAKEHNIIIYEDKPLARTLYDLVEIDEFIPSEQYQAVAKVISYVFQQRDKR